MIIRFVCCRLLPALVALLAIFVGHILSTENPMGTFFWYVHQPLWLLSKTKATPEVPETAVPLPRPAKELFLDLPGNVSMPANGLGMCCRATAYHDESVRRTVLHYLLLGGRHVDTAEVYLNHRPIGEAIREAVRRGVPRSEIFVTTKIDPSNFGTDRTRAWIPKMLLDLQLDYVDLVLLHAPRRWMGFVGGASEFEGCCGCPSPRECREQTWRVLSDARDRGVVRNIGVSNFRVRHMEELRALDLAPIAVDELQYHPWVPDWQEEIARYCRKNGIRMTAYFSLGGAQNAASATALEALRTIAASHGKNVTAGQLLLRWSIQKGLCVIPGTGNPDHMQENLAVYDFALSPDDMARIDALGGDEGMRKKFMFFDMPGEL